MQTHIHVSSGDLFRGWGAQAFPTPEVDFPSLDFLKHYYKSDFLLLKNQQLIIMYRTHGMIRVGHTHTHTPPIGNHGNSGYTSPSKWRL